MSLVSPTTRVPSANEHPDLAGLVVPSTGAYLRKHTHDQGRTLEVGCGPGQYQLTVNGAYVGVDITTAPYNDKIPRSVDAVADGNSLPFTDDSFDLVFFSNVFHFLPNARQVLLETMRATKPGGLIVIFDYSKRALEDLKRRASDEGSTYVAYVRSVTEWTSLLEGYGLRQVTVTLNTSAVRARLARFLLPDTAYRTLTDRVSSGIVVKAQVP